MSTKNKMNIIGYLGADPELRYTSSGRSVANLRIATTERWTDKAGTAQEHTEWHRVVAWANLAEASAKYLKKGSLVSIEGPIRSRKFTDKEGVQRLRPLNCPRTWCATVTEIRPGSILEPRNSRIPGASATAPKTRNSDFGLNIIGYLGADPELRHTSSDRPVGQT